MRFSAAILGVWLVVAPAVWGADPPLNPCPVLNRAVGPAHPPFVTGTPEELRHRFDPTHFQEDVALAVESMEWQLAGDAKRAGGERKRLKFRLPTPNSVHEESFLMANVNRAVNGALAPILARLDYPAASALKPSKRLVLVVHQWSGELEGKKLQAETAKYLDEKFKDDPVVLVASHNFPITNPELLAAGRRGGLIYSQQGAIVHRDSTGRVFQRDVPVDTGELVVMGGFCGVCMQRAASGAIQMAFENPARRELKVKVPPGLAYNSDGEILAGRLRSPLSRRNQLLVLALRYVPDSKVWKPKGDAAMEVLGDTGRITFYDSSQPEGQQREIHFDFNE